MTQIQISLAEVVLHGVGRPLPLKRADQTGEPGLHSGAEAQRLAHFPCSGAAAIGDDIGAHRSSELAVALVNVLDGTLAVDTRGQIQVDVRPLAPNLREKALEEQLHADRVHGGDAKRVADGGVGGGAATLNQDAVFPAELDDVPDDEEVAGKSQLRDEREFRIDLLVGFSSQLRAGLRAIAPRHATPSKVRFRKKLSMLSPSEIG